MDNNNSVYIREFLDRAPEVIEEPNILGFPLYKSRIAFAEQSVETHVNNLVSTYNKDIVIAELEKQLTKLKAS